MISEAIFAEKMTETGIYEGQPHLGVAVSGGSDSMALALLAQAWCKPRQGHLTALIVDHQLRPGSSEETRRVAGWLASRGIESIVLEWRHSGGEPISSGIQQRARAARYRLFADWCRANGVLHLLVGHTRDDQAETYLMRLEKGSGPDGLAAMSRIRETAECRIIRPLLGVSRAALRLWLSSLGQPWIDDPSNADPRFRRSEIRKLFEDGTFDAIALAASAARFEAARRVLDDAAAGLLARACKLAPAGYAELDLVRIRHAPEDLALRCLGQVITVIGGRPYPPRRRAVETMLGELTSVVGLRRTLGGCLLSAHGGNVLICREARNLPEPKAVSPGVLDFWDGRFLAHFNSMIGVVGRPKLAALGNRVWHQIASKRTVVEDRTSGFLDVLPTLPALFDDQGVFSVPHLGYIRGVDACVSARDCGFAEVKFAPRNSLVGVGFAVV